MRVESVADHPDAAIQRRPDHGLEVIVARRSKQHCFRIRAQRLRNARQDDVAHDFRPRRAARFAGEMNADAKSLKALGEPRRMGRLAGAFPAFEGNEASAHPYQPRTAQ
jgi:hypothetical protein